jgi:hypothetical protein
LLGNVDEVELSTLNAPSSTMGEPLRRHKPGDEEPLLSGSSSPSMASYSSIAKSGERLEDNIPEILLDRSVENDVLPETAVLGRNLGWSSAYILIISRVIGSGIFATPGAIVKGVGSIGITLVLWVVGALISWFGLAISLEYGCMLPRSGGMLIKWYLLDFCSDCSQEKRYTSSSLIGAPDFSPPS